MNQFGNTPIRGGCFRCPSRRYSLDRSKISEVPGLNEKAPFGALPHRPDFLLRPRLLCPLAMPAYALSIWTAPEDRGYPARCSRLAARTEVKSQHGPGQDKEPWSIVGGLAGALKSLVKGTSFET